MEKKGWPFSCIFTDLVEYLKLKLKLRPQSRGLDRV